MATTLPGPSEAELRVRLAREHALRAQAALDRLAEQRRQAGLRQAHERTLNILRAAAAGVILLGLLAVGFYGGWLPDPLRTTATARIDPADNFAETKTGQVIVTPPFGNQCRQFSFNNETGQMSNQRQIDCNDVTVKESSPSTGLSTGSDRLGSIRDTFKKR